jgi:hypothetical protein
MINPMKACYTDNLAQVAEQTVLGEIAQRLSSANVRISDVTARLKEIHGRAFGSMPEPVEKIDQAPKAHSAVSEIQNMFGLLENRLMELEGRTSAFNKFV